MKLLYVGTASKPEFSSIRYVYVEQNTNKYYIASCSPPEHYISVRDESNDFMLFERPTRMIRVPNTKYDQELHNFMNNLSPASQIDLNNRKIISREGLEFDFNPAQ